MDSDRWRLDVGWSSEDECFVVTVPELPGCMAHGDSYAEAVEHAQTAVQLQLETAEEMGRPIPERISARRFDGRSLLRLPVGLHRQLAYEVGGQGVS
jgi:predicted RNase H-like HicB family nuclease